jgi:uncharacterized lipoprotein NlpE involved in copper resistance
MKKVAITLMMVSVFALVGCQETSKEMMLDAKIPGELQPIANEIKAEMEVDLGVHNPEDVQLAQRLTKEVEDLARDLNQMMVTTAQEKAILVSKNNAATAKKLAEKIVAMAKDGNKYAVESYLVSIKNKIDRITSYKKEADLRKKESIETITRAKEEVLKAKAVYNEWKIAMAKANMQVPQLDDAMLNGFKRAEQKIAEKENLLTSYESDLDSILVDVEKTYEDAKKIVDSMK